MALLQISEPQESVFRQAIGIDLGTTNSLIANVQNNKPHIICDKSPLLPSVVHFGTNGVVVGESAKTKISTDEHNTIWSVKRSLGLTLKQIENPHPALIEENNSLFYQTRHGKKSPSQVSAEILRQLTTNARKTLGGQAQSAVICVPAYFDDIQRQLTKEAATLANISVLRLLNEPTAAAVAYGLDTIKSGTIVVYDFGGGTFDVSILKIHQKVFKVIAVNGNTSLGGDEIDFALARFIQNNFLPNKNSTNVSGELILFAKKVKEWLSNNSTEEQYLGKFQNTNVQINRTAMNEIITPICAKTLQYVKLALQDAELETSDINKVVMVGGSSKLGFIQRKVEQFFSIKALCSIDPEQVVALGAALHAHAIQNPNDKKQVLLDVIPLSLGIETLGGLFEKIIPRNTSIPIAKGQEFTTSEDNQIKIKITVYQGERELVHDCRKLADFVVTDIPPMPAGQPRVRITFAVDNDGLLRVSAEEKVTGNKTSIDVYPSHNLNTSNISKMLKDSIEQAKEDMLKRSLIESKTAASSIIKLTREAINKDGDLLTKEETKRINHTIQELANLCENSEYSDKIDQQKDMLIDITNDFAARRMDSTIKKALQGSNINTMSK